MIYKTLLNKQKQNLINCYTVNKTHTDKKDYISKNYEPQKRPIKRYKSKLLIIFKNFIKICNILKNNFLISCYEKTNKYFKYIIKHNCYKVENYKIKFEKKINFKKNKTLYININDEYKNYIHNNVYEFNFINTNVTLKSLYLPYLNNISYETVNKNIKIGVFEIINEFIKNMNKTIFGQELNVNQIANNLTNLNNKKSSKPIASYFLCGPSGTGKTELAKMMSKYIYKKTSSLIMKDMSTFADSSSVSKFIGSAPGYLGHEEKGTFVDEILKTPNSLVLFDEIEKADKKVYSIFLQILDEGILTNAKRKVGRFNKSIIIFTSNLGSTILDNKNVNFYLCPDYAYDIQKSIEKHFAPEFINRLDSIVIFNPLNLCSLYSVFDKFIENNYYNMNHIDKILKYFTLLFSISPSQGARFLFYNINKFLLQVKLYDNTSLYYDTIYSFLFK